ncbi:hypothetical protein [Amycolatopsis minnesotensis]|uniref:Uncharacterized protein n=1 Tax=Amycolatopsis minnesotensis TaxID=337894 RepID=A0ABN2SXH5_9PSEU
MSDIGYTILLISVFVVLAMALRLAEHRLRHRDDADQTAGRRPAR